MTFQFVAEQQGYFPVRRLCRSLGVSASGYYAWRHRPPSQRSLVNQLLLMHIRAVYAANRRTYGSPRIQAELQACGFHFNRKRVVRLMRLNHLRARH